jgi:hypothetical protein
MNDQAEITVRRCTGYTDRLRAYKVVVDGVVVTSIRAGKSVGFPVAPGRHTLALQIDWCGSGEQEFEAQPGEQLSFECGSSLTGWRILLVFEYIFFRTREYLWLRRTARPFANAA